MWTAEDRAKAEAYESWEHHQTCQKCGTHPDWWDPKAGGHRYAFIADFERCPGCEVVEQLQGQMPRDVKGVRVVLKVNPNLLGSDKEA